MTKGNRAIAGEFWGRESYARVDGGRSRSRQGAKKRTLTTYLVAGVVAVLESCGRARALPHAGTGRHALLEDGAGRAISSSPIVGMLGFQKVSRECGSGRRAEVLRERGGAEVGASFDGDTASTLSDPAYTKVKDFMALERRSSWADALPLKAGGSVPRCTTRRTSCS